MSPASYYKRRRPTSSGSSSKSYHSRSHASHHPQQQQHSGGSKSPKVSVAAKRRSCGSPIKTSFKFHADKSIRSTKPARGQSINRPTLESVMMDGADRHSSASKRARSPRDSHYHHHEEATVARSRARSTSTSKPKQQFVFTVSLAPTGKDLDPSQTSCSSSDSEQEQEIPVEYNYRHGSKYHPTRKPSPKESRRFKRSSNHDAHFEDIETQDLEIPYRMHWSDGSDSYDSDGGNWISPTHNREPLRPGDIIEYTSPVFVAGNPQGHRIAMIWHIKDLGTNKRRKSESPRSPNHKKNRDSCHSDSDSDSDDEDSSVYFPLGLNNGELIPYDTCVRRIYEYRNKEWLPHSGGTYKEVATFRLQPGGLTEKTTANSGFLQKIQRLRADKQRVMKNAWKKLQSGEFDQTDSSDSESDRHRKQSRKPATTSKHSVAKSKRPVASKKPKLPLSVESSSSDDEEPNAHIQVDDDSEDDDTQRAVVRVTKPHKSPKKKSPSPSKKPKTRKAESSSDSSSSSSDDDDKKSILEAAAAKRRVKAKKTIEQKKKSQKQREQKKKPNVPLSPPPLPPPCDSSSSSDSSDEEEPLLLPTSPNRRGNTEEPLMPFADSSSDSEDDDDVVSPPTLKRGLIASSISKQHSQPSNDGDGKDYSSKSKASQSLPPPSLLPKETSTKKLASATAQRRLDESWSMFSATKTTAKMADNDDDDGRETIDTIEDSVSTTFTNGNSSCINDNSNNKSHSKQSSGCSTPKSKDRRETKSTESNILLTPLSKNSKQRSRTPKSSTPSRGKRSLNFCYTPLQLVPVSRKRSPATNSPSKSPRSSSKSPRSSSTEITTPPLPANKQGLFPAGKNSTGTRIPQRSPANSSGDSSLSDEGENPATMRPRNILNNSEVRSTTKAGDIVITTRVSEEDDDESSKNATGKQTVNSKASSSAIKPSDIIAVSNIRKIPKNFTIDPSMPSSDEDDDDDELLNAKGLSNVGRKRSKAKDVSIKQRSDKPPAQITEQLTPRVPPTSQQKPPSQISAAKEQDVSKKTESKSNSAATQTQESLDDSRPNRAASDYIRNQTSKRKSRKNLDAGKSGVWYTSQRSNTSRTSSSTNNSIGRKKREREEIQPAKRTAKKISSSASTSTATSSTFEFSAHDGNAKPQKRTPIILAHEIGGSQSEAVQKSKRRKVAKGKPIRRVVDPSQRG